jgi:hypothetical protein
MNKYIPVRYDTEWKVICELCDKSFNKLWSHLRMTHRMLTSDYRKQFWLDRCAKLMSEFSIDLARERNKENYELVVKENLIARWVKTRYKEGDKWRTLDKMSPQTIKRVSELYKTVLFTKNNKMIYEQEKV